MRLREDVRTIEVIVLLVEVSRYWIAPGKPVNFVACCFGKVNIEIVKLIFPVRMLRISVQIGFDLDTFMNSKCMCGGKLKQLISQATPETNDDHKCLPTIILWQN